jgi:2,3-bisphosphoglycerate-dependent phosphoglycerate mutase
MSRVTVVFVRHGETQENRDKVIQGQMDSQLNELGRRQADAVAFALRDVPFTRALSSDLSRAKHVCTFQTCAGRVTHACRM